MGNDKRKFRQTFSKSYASKNNGYKTRSCVLLGLSGIAGEHGFGALNRCTAPRLRDFVADPNIWLPEGSRHTRREWLEPSARLRIEVAAARPIRSRTPP